MNIILSRQHTLKQEQSETAYVRQNFLDADPVSGPGLSPKFNRHFLVHEYICDKIFTKIPSLSLEEDWPNYGKCPISSQCWRLLQKIPGSKSGLGFNHFQNSIISCSSTDTSLVKFDRRSVQTFLRKVANRCGTVCQAMWLRLRCWRCSNSNQIKSNQIQSNLLAANQSTK